MPEPVEPISEQIVQFVVARLETITQDNEYSMDVTVERFDPKGNAKGAPNGRGMIVVQEESPVYNVNVGDARDGYSLRIAIFCFVKNNAGATSESWGTVTARMAADVVKCLAPLPHVPTGVSGWALPITDINNGAALGDLPAVSVNLDLRFLTGRNDPYALA